MQRIIFIFIFIFAFACKVEKSSAQSDVFNNEDVKISKPKEKITQPVGEVTLRVKITGDTIDIYALGSKPMGGFQFDVVLEGNKDVVTKTDLIGFTIKDSFLKNSDVLRVLGFSMEGKTINFPKGEEKICSIESSGSSIENIELTNIVLASPRGKAIGLKSVKYEI